jgi:YfiH family protein
MSDAPNSLAPLQSPLLAALPGVRHAFFTREGGVSQGIYASLNVGRGSRDDPQAVQANRARAAAWFGLDEPSLLCAYQIHSATAHKVDGGWATPPQGDALVTRTPGLALGALSADCAPILIADPEAGVVAAVHAGWRGALGGVIAAAVAGMTELGARPAAMTAAVGPCIGPSSYEVGLEFEAEFLAQAPASAAHFALAPRDDKRLFDLPGFVLRRLAEAGVSQAEWIGADTRADAARFFSHRRATQQGEGDYGRLLSAILLED